MKILFVTHDFTKTGAPISLSLLIQAIKESGKDTIDIAYIYDRGDEELRETFEHFSDSPLKSIRNLIRRPFIPFKKAPEYDFILLNTIVSGEVIKQLVDLAPTVVTWIHEMEFTIRQYGMHLAEDIVHYSAEVWGVNNIITTFFDELGANTWRFNEILTSEIPEIVSTGKNGSSGLSLASAGLPSWRKGVYDIPKLIQQASTEIEALTWYGASEVDQTIQQVRYQLRKMGLASKFAAAGVVKKLTENLLEHDVFLLLSHEDPFPLVCLEAAGSGVPIICWDKGTGIVDFVQDDAGWIIPYADFGTLGELLAQLNKNREEISKRGSVARKKSLSAYSPGVRAREFGERVRKLKA